MKNALIFSSSFDGHRQVYVFVIANILAELGYEIFIAGNFSDKLNNSYYIDFLRKDSRINKIDTNMFTGHGLLIDNNDFVNLQEKYNIGLTIFTDADHHIALFNSQLLLNNKRIQGQRFGIFLRPWYFYEKSDWLSKLRYLKTLRITWRSDARLFHGFLNNTFKLLNASLHIDEFFVSKHRKNTWLPDVFQQYADKLVSEVNSEQRIWIKKINKFLEANKGCFVLLYFGTAQPRRGYDELLKLATDHKACFVHCGLRNENEVFRYNVDELRLILKGENRLFETDEFITDPYCIEYFFRTVDRLVLPYNDFLSSSGVMLQALGYGIPVLVPDFGLIGYRVKKFNLGLTYSVGALEKQFLLFKEIPKDYFKSYIEKYMEFQSADFLKVVLSNIFSGAKRTFLHP